MKKIKAIILIITCILTIFFFPLIWTIIGYAISLLSKFNWFINIQNFISTYSFIDRSQYIDFFSTLLCIVTSSVLGYAAYKISRKSTHNSNVKMALFIKTIFEMSLKSVYNIYKHIPNQKIEVPEFNFFEHEFTFLSDSDIALVYNIYLKILQLSNMPSSYFEMNSLAEEILIETMINKDQFNYNSKYKEILDKANNFFENKD